MSLQLPSSLESYTYIQSVPLSESTLAQRIDFAHAQADEWRWQLGRSGKLTVDEAQYLEGIREIWLKWARSYSPAKQELLCAAHCGNCKFYFADANSPRGLCRRRAPCLGAGWAEVQEDSLCGEWEAKP